MANKQAKDRYDRAPKKVSRVGAHRTPRRRGGGLLALVWALIAIIVLVGAGIVAILAINGKLDEGLGGLNLRPGASDSASPEPTGAPPSTDADDAAPTNEPTTEPTPEVVPTRDPSLTVLVLNGTTVTGLAGDLTDELSDLGWSLADPANAADSGEPATIVYYTDEADEGAALGLVDDLSGHADDVQAQLADDANADGADITVVIGADFTS